MSTIILSLNYEVINSGKKIKVLRWNYFLSVFKVGSKIFFRHEIYDYYLQLDK